MNAPPKVNLDAFQSRLTAAQKALINTLAQDCHVHHVSVVQLSIEALAGFCAEVSPLNTGRYLRAIAQTIDDVTAHGEPSQSTVLESKAAMDSVLNDVMLLAADPAGSA